MTCVFRKLTTWASHIGPCKYWSKFTNGSNLNKAEPGPAHEKEAFFPNKKTLDLYYTSSFSIRVKLSLSLSHANTPFNQTGKSLSLSLWFLWFNLILLWFTLRCSKIIKTLALRLVWKTLITWAKSLHLRDPLLSLSLSLSASIIVFHFQFLTFSVWENQYLCFHTYMLV